MNCDSLTFRAWFVSHRCEVDLRSMLLAASSGKYRRAFSVSVKWRLEFTKVGIVVDEQWNEGNEPLGSNHVHASIGKRYHSTAP